MYSWELLKHYFTLSSTRQSSFLWRFLRTWCRTPQAFLEHHLLERRTATTPGTSRRTLFEWCGGSLTLTNYKGSTNSLGILRP